MLSARAVPAVAIGIPIPVDPGQLIVQAGAEGFATFSEQIDIAASERVEVTIELQPRETPAANAEAEEPPDVSPEGTQSLRGRGGVFGSGLGFGFGGVGAALFAAFGALALQRREDLQESCGGDVCPESYRDELNQGRLYQTLANVGIALGAVGLIVGVAFLIVELRQRRDNAREGRVHFLGSGLVVDW
jgi:hypothetical protein